MPEAYLKYILVSVSHKATDRNRCCVFVILQMVTHCFSLPIEVEGLLDSQIVATRTFADMQDDGTAPPALLLFFSSSSCSRCPCGF